MNNLKTVQITLNKFIVVLGLIIICCNCSQENDNNNSDRNTSNKNQESTDTLKREQIFKFFESTSSESIEEVSYRMYNYFCSYPQDVIKNLNLFNLKLAKFNLTISQVLCNEIFIQYEGHLWSEEKLDEYLNQLFVEYPLSTLKSEVRKCILE
jgi:hypothetical protein